MPRKQEIQFEQPSDLLLLTNKYLTIIIGLIVLIVLLVGYYILLNPKIITIQDMKLATSQYIDEQQRDELLIKEMGDLQTEYERILVSRQRDLEKIKNMFPADPQIAELFVMVEKLAQNRGFRLRNVEFVKDVTAEGRAPVLEEIRPDDVVAENADFQVPNSPSESTELKNLVIQMQVYTPVAEEDSKLSFGETIEESEESVGNYAAFKLFLDDVERNLRLMDIQTVGFGPMEELDSVSELFDFSIITYYRG